MLASVKPHGLDPDDVMEYEIAEDRLNYVIGIYTAWIREAEKSDPAAVDSLTEAQIRYIGVRKALRPADRERVAQVLRECAEIIRQYTGR
nr:hypothetical protein [Kibdelosporangium sp. MJ126-NF4]